MTHSVQRDVGLLLIVLGPVVTAMGWAAFTDAGLWMIVAGGVVALAGTATSPTRGRLLLGLGCVAACWWPFLGLRPLV